MSSPADRKTLEEKTTELKTKRRDCRTCRAFNPDEQGRGFGWCSAFEQYVKLYHPPGGFWSQCQFKVISRAPLVAEPGPDAEAELAEPVHPHPSPEWRPQPVRAEA